MKIIMLGAANPHNARLMLSARVRQGPPGTRSEGIEFAGWLDDTKDRKSVV